MKIRLFALLVLTTSGGLAQQPNVAGTFHFTTPPKNIEEAATILRTVFDIRQVTVDSAQSTLLFSGSAAQVAAGEWALGELDRPGGEDAVHSYTLPSGEIIRVNFLANVTTPQSMQELLTVLRTVADVQRLFNFTGRQAIVIRAKPTDMAFTQWIIDNLNQPAKQGFDPAPRVYSEITPYNQVAQANVLTNVSTPQQMQQILTVLRTVADIMKVFNYTARQTLVLRARQVDMDRAEWLLERLNGAPQPGTIVYASPGADDITRVFFLSNAGAQGAQYATTAIRSGTGIRKVFYTNAPAAVVVRGTADQIEAAAQLMAQKNGF